MDDVNVIDEGEEKRTFEYYLDLPEEMRTPIIDRMRERDRCRFAGTSKMNNKEAKASKHYLYKLELQPLATFFLLKIYYTKRPEEGFNIKFNNLANHKSVDLHLRGRPRRNLLSYSQTRYDNSVDMLEYCVEHFKNLWKHYQKSIQSLVIHRDEFSEGLGTFDFGVSNFRNLQELAIDQIYMEHLLPKIRHPLKKLIIYEEFGDEDLANFEQIYQVQEELEFLYTGFDDNQLYRISTPIATVHIGILSVEDVYNFLCDWQDGVIERELRRIKWMVPFPYNFDALELFQCFENTRPDGFREIIQPFEGGKRGLLMHAFDSFEFAVL